MFNKKKNTKNLWITLLKTKNSQCLWITLRKPGGQITLNQDNHT